MSYRLDATPDGAWILLGRTPLQDVRVPREMLRWRITKGGFEPVDDVGVTFTATRITLRHRLDAVGTTPVGMVRVLAAGVRFSIFIPGLEHVPAVEVGDYWIDRYEVTNQEFKRFVDDGGYRNRAFWKQPFDADSRTLSWEEGVARFRDVTGRPGPSMWELSAYPAGQANYPVTGVSWYEAAAYAEYTHKQLPTIFHWSRAAGQLLSGALVPVSNFGGRVQFQLVHHRR